MWEVSDGAGGVERRVDRSGSRDDLWGPRQPQRHQVPRVDWYLEFVAAVEGHLAQSPLASGLENPINRYTPHRPRPSQPLPPFRLQTLTIGRNAISAPLVHLLFASSSSSLLSLTLEMGKTHLPTILDSLPLVANSLNSLTFLAPLPGLAPALSSLTALTHLTLHIAYPHSDLHEYELVLAALTQPVESITLVPVPDEGVLQALAGRSRREMWRKVTGVEFGEDVASEVGVKATPGGNELVWLCEELGITVGSY